LSLKLKDTSDDKTDNPDENNNLSILTEFDDDRFVLKEGRYFAVSEPIFPSLQFLSLVTPPSDTVNLDLFNGPFTSNPDLVTPSKTLNIENN